MFNEEFILKYNIKPPMSNIQPSGPPPPPIFPGSIFKNIK